MLRSIARHFNETVFRGPENEGAGGGWVDPADVDVGSGADADVGGDDPADDDGGDRSTEKLTVREQLKRSIAEVAEADKDKGKAPRDKAGRFKDPKEPVAAKPADGAAPADPAQAQPAAAALEPPAALSPEAKAAWAQTPPVVQAAILKREQDMQAGVDQLKNRYALIDQAIAPHTDALRQMNATPQDAVNRMFLWFKALAGNPTEAFPALAQSLGIPWDKLSARQQQAAQQQQPGQVDPNAAATGPATGAPEIPAPVKEYVDRMALQLQQATQVISQQNQRIQQLDQRFGSVEQNFNAANEAKTVENLNIWSKDKPYFQEVRQIMAKLLETGVVPVKPDGQVDLDTAYERAIYFSPEVRAKVLAEQQQANTQVQQQAATAATTAQQAQVGKARKAAVSLPASTTPGTTSAQIGGAVKKKPGTKMSVRDSLNEAITTLRDQ